MLEGAVIINAYGLVENSDAWIKNQGIVSTSAYYDGDPFSFSEQTFLLDFKVADTSPFQIHYRIRGSTTFSGLSRYFTFKPSQKIGFGIRSTVPVGNWNWNTKLPGTLVQPGDILVSEIFMEASSASGTWTPFKTSVIEGWQTNIYDSKVIDNFSVSCTEYCYGNSITPKNFLGPNFEMPNNLKIDFNLTFNMSASQGWFQDSYIHFPIILRFWLDLAGYKSS